MQKNWKNFEKKSKLSIFHVFYKENFFVNAITFDSGRVFSSWDMLNDPTIMCYNINIETIVES